MPGGARFKTHFTCRKRMEAERFQGASSHLSLNVGRMIGGTTVMEGAGYALEVKMNARKSNFGQELVIGKSEEVNSKYQKSLNQIYTFASLERFFLHNLFEVGQTPFLLRVGPLIEPGHSRHTPLRNALHPFQVRPEQFIETVTAGHWNIFSSHLYCIMISVFTKQLVGVSARSQGEWLEGRE